MEWTGVNSSSAQRVDIYFTKKPNNQTLSPKTTKQNENPQQKSPIQTTNKWTLKKCVKPELYRKTKGETNKYKVNLGTNQMCIF